MRRTDRYRYPFMMTLLVLLQFTVRSRLGSLVSGEHADQVAPDFLLLALLIYTIRAEPGKSAAAGCRPGGPEPSECRRERVPSTPARSPPGRGAHGRVDRPRHPRAVVLPHADPRARQVPAAIGDEPAAADSAARAAWRHLRPQRARAGGERAGVHGLTAARPRSEFALDAGPHRVDREHRQRGNRARVTTRPQGPVSTGPGARG